MKLSRQGIRKRTWEDLEDKRIVSEIRKGSILLRSCGDQRFVLMAMTAVYNLEGEMFYLSWRFQRLCSMDSSSLCYA